MLDVRGAFVLLILDRLPDRLAESFFAASVVLVDIRLLGFAVEVLPAGRRD